VIKKLAIAAATGASVIGLFVSLGVTPAASAKTGSILAHAPLKSTAQQERVCDVGIISRQRPRLIKTTQYGKVVWLIVRTSHRTPLIADIPCVRPRGLGGEESNTQHLTG
jgi:hypothetical protein